MAKKVYISEEQFGRLQNIIKEDDNTTTVSITPPLDGNKNINPNTPIPDAQVKDVVNDFKRNPVLKQQLDKGKVNVQPIGKMSPQGEKMLKDTLNLGQTTFQSNNANESIVLTKKSIEESRINKMISEGECFSKKEFSKIILK